MQHTVQDKELPLGDWIEQGVNWLVENAGPVFDTLRWPIEQVLDNAEALLLWVPWYGVLLAIAAIAWLRNGWKIALVSIVGLILINLMGYWEATMTTLSMILTALFFCVVVGLPLGILMAKNTQVERVFRPILDAMQTIHPFVYLVPIVMLFGIGKVPGTLATIIFSLPPITRLTNLGIRHVSKGVVEAGEAFGTSDLQLLFEIQMPLAMPSIMAGLNQSLMLALSMVVIVALIAGGGLGQEIYGAVSSLQIGQAFESGLAVLILAIVLDRISQTTNQPTTT